MRIGTWNLEGRWSPQHRELLVSEACDVWLLTEVPIDIAFPAMQIHHTAELMDPRKSWAAIASSSPVVVEPDPHRATASAAIAGVRFMSSVLPWRTCGQSWPGSNLAEKQKATLDTLRPQIASATVWGGDWNQALGGSENVGTLEGRRTIVAMLNAARLTAPTGALGSASPGHRTIDHIAVPLGWDVSRAYRIEAKENGKRISDHDAYVVEVSR